MNFNTTFNLEITLEIYAHALRINAARGRGEARDDSASDG